MSNRALISLGLLVVAAVLALQQHSLHKLRRELAQLRAQDTASSAPITPVAAGGGEPQRVVNRVVPPDVSGLGQRLQGVEEAIAQLNQGADHLMDRGLIPPNQAKLEEYRIKFLDPQASVRDRLNALRFLRRNQALSPDVMQAVVFWLQQSTEPDTTRMVLEGLSGVNDPLLFGATYQLAATSADPRVREQAVRNLQAFGDNPQVATLLWSIVSSESGGNLRRRAEETLFRLPMNQQRLASLRTHALDPAAPLDQRTLALRLMQRGKADIADVAASLAQAGRFEQDKARRLEYLRAFDEVTHATFLPSIVEALQDADPEIRVRATDTLRDYRSDATARQWLEHLAQSDPDERVRREAARALPSDRGRGGGP